MKADVDGITGEGTSIELTIPDAKLWSDTAPNLYTAKISAGDDDTVEIPFGIRQITCSNKGLFISGRETLLRGGCVHHDSGTAKHHRLSNGFVHADQSCETKTCLL